VPVTDENTQSGNGRPAASQANVAPRHLLDTRLNPPAELRATMQVSLVNDGPVTLLLDSRRQL
jgi:D-Tyr-tRNAtyr deacylase